MSRTWMPRRQLELLSIGVFFVIVAVCLIIYAAQYITRIDEFFSLILVFYGLWVMIFAGIKPSSQDRYERSSFSVFAWGLLLTAVGGAWFLNIQTSNLVYSLALVLLIIGILVVTSALRSWRG